MKYALLVLAACHSASPPHHGPTGNGIQIFVDAPGSPAELERLVTIPIEQAIGGIGAAGIHSTTQSGRVVVTFELGDADAAAARQQVLAKLKDAALPAGVSPALGPFTSRDGVLVRYALHSDQLSPTQLRMLQDWTIRPALIHAPGVADVSTCGGFVEEIVIDVDPARLAGVSLGDIVTAISHDDLRTAKQLTFDDVSNIVVKNVNGAPIRVDDIATVIRGRAPQTCYAIDDRGAGIVEGTVWLRPGLDRERVRSGVTQALAAVRAELPASVTLDPITDTADAVVALPPASFAEQARAVAMLRDPASHATLELGADAGGFASDVPDEVRVRLATAGDAAAVRAHAKQLATATWIDDEPTAWVKVYGADLDQLGKLADQLAAKLEVVERTGAAMVPVLEVKPDRDRLAELHLTLAAVTDATQAARTGLPAGWLQDKEQRIPIMIRIAQAVPDLHVGSVPLTAVAEVRQVLEPRVILRDRGRRWVGIRVRARDLAALRDQIRTATLPPGYEAVVTE